MYISKMILNNFKSFKGTHEINFSNGVNYFVGNNNFGKTTLFYALEFITGGASKSDVVSNTCPKEDVSVEIYLSDVNKEIIPQKYQRCIQNNTIRIKRSSKEETIIQNGKPVTLNIKKVRVYNPEKNEEKLEGQFENISGIDKTIKELLSFTTVYAEMQNNEFQNFGSTKITGKLIEQISRNFVETEIYKTFIASYEKAFRTDKEGFKENLSQTLSSINSTMNDQFGNVQIGINFNIPDIHDFIKNANFTVKENKKETNISENGNGLQRALAFSIIQVFAKQSRQNKQFPLFFLLDEPELYLHPKAQDNLLNAINDLSEFDQFFITTHSPYILRHLRNNKDKVIILNKSDKNSPIDTNDLIFDSISIGEITYKAFHVPTADFHSELFTKLYVHWVETTPTQESHGINAFEKDFLLPKVQDNPDLIKLMQERYNAGKFKPSKQHSLPFIIRNTIDHPELREGGHNFPITDQDLKISIDFMIKLQKTI
ncbi:Predicted ATPase [Fructobacillus evanidus]|nr:Predicted ATPase [Fructobacillus sp. LMG 32999]